MSGISESHTETVDSSFNFLDFAGNVYFTTICSLGKQKKFGEIVTGSMQLNTVGTVAQQLWNEQPNPSNRLKVGATVVMPNHVHAMIWIGQGSTTPEEEKKILSEFVSTYKVSVLEMVAEELQFKLNSDKLWQRGFYHYQIPNETAYHLLHSHLKNNAHEWLTDRFYTE